MDEQRDVVIVGAGGHAREAFDLLVETYGQPFRSHILGFVDDGFESGVTVGHTRLKILGPVALLAELETDYVLGIASPAVRRRLDLQLTDWGRSALAAVHPTVGVGSGAVVGDGCLVPFGCRLSEGVALGRHVHLGVGNNIAHGTSIGDYSIVTPGALVSGDCSIGSDVWIGAGAVVNQGLHIGDRATVGSGAMVITDVPADVVVVGVPARPVSKGQTP